jgi:hypothetical protein
MPVPRELHNQYSTPPALARQTLVKHSLVGFVVTGDQELEFVGQPMLEFVVA